MGSIQVTDAKHSMLYGPVLRFINEMLGPLPAKAKEHARGVHLAHSAVATRQRVP